MSKSESGREKRPNELSGTAYEYTRPGVKNGSGKHNLDAETVQRVYEHLRDECEFSYPKTRDVASGMDISRTLAGQALSMLADDPDCPLDVERWSAEGQPNATWQVEVGR